MTAALDISWIGALAGLALAIILILFRLAPTYALILGAIVGAFIGGANFSEVINILISGTQSVQGTVIRIIAAGVFAGVMMESGSAGTIAEFIVDKLGGTKAMLSLALATMVITAVGVFIPVAVLIVAPIALSVGNKMGYSKIALLVALSGGGKAGNIISPNPNTIAAAGGFQLDVNQVMLGGVVPALVGLAVTVIIASFIKFKGTKVTDLEAAELEKTSSKNLPPLSKALVAPVIAIVLLMISPIGSMLGADFLAKLKIDSLFILPFAGVVGALTLGKSKEILNYCTAGLNRMTPTILIIIGAGAIGGLITASTLPAEVVALVESSGISGVFLAPIAGVLMAGATASTSTGVILATGSFSNAILNTGVAPLSAAVMTHAGATVIDHLPHGTYFHVTRNAMGMSMKDRLKVALYESIVGLAMTIVAVVLFGFIL
ncbi:High-affinity gluconate transporter [compost metagenome]|uniref:GntP family permease n=1 Tax=Paenibacillus rhizolycopersici TaxID=2780073 RepID=A0ABS2HDK9_9BACL|nr:MULTISPECIES: TRAP transporter large permease subunit [Paenibacillus]MBM6998488.1 GntP family permease [Paenibacillus rhizolycopersici]GIP50035.1 gluconate:proton symporter [Paenibacillus sp. J53TS2]